MCAVVHRRRVVVLYPGLKVIQVWGSSPYTVKESHNSYWQAQQHQSSSDNQVSNFASVRQIRPSSFGSSVDWCFVRMRRWMRFVRYNHVPDRRCKRRVRRRFGCGRTRRVVRHLPIESRSDRTPESTMCRPSTRRMHRQLQMTCILQYGLESIGPPGNDCQRRCDLHDQW